MSARQNLSIHLAARPSPHIIPGTTFRPRLTPAPTASDLQPGELLLETLYISLDPAMRGWLDDAPSYMPPVQVGEVMRGATISRVLATSSSSTSSNFSKGDLVTTFGPGWTEVSVLPEAAVRPVRLPPSNGKVTDVLGVLGLNGLTAYFGLTEIGRPRAGETVVVSGAAGATGSVVGQIARNVYGARVVGIAGGREKTAWLEELGFDVVLDYRDEEFGRKFDEATENGVDVYWDGVGGEILDLALGKANKNARFVECGMIGFMHGEEPYPLKNLFKIISQRIKMEGFIVTDYMAKVQEAGMNLAQWVGEGKIKSRETIVKGGLKVAEEALLRLFEGQNIGKMMVEVKSPDEE